MKKNIFTKAALCGMIVATLFNSCDDIDENERFIPGEVTPFVFTPDTILIEAEGIGFEVIQMHRPLIEDYTGWNCTNCPNIAAFIDNKIKPDYQAIVVGLHPASNLLSRTAPGFPFQLSSALADTYGDYFGGSAANLSLPAIAVNRIKQDGRYLFSGDTATVQNIATATAFDSYYAYNIDNSAPLISLGLDVKEQNGIYTITTLLLSHSKIETPLKLQLWIIENGINGLQAHKSGTSAYLHNHVLREAVNGDWGESVVLQSDRNIGFYLATNVCEWSAEGKNFIPENCEAVAFVYNAETREVLNTIKAEL